METHPYALSWLFFNELLWGREKCKGLICMDEIEERKKQLFKWREYFCYLDFLFRFLFFPILGRFTAGDIEKTRKKSRLHLHIRDMDGNDDRGAGEAMLKGSASRRVSSSSSGWRKMLMCCLKPEEDDVQVLDYEHSSLSDVPAEVFNHERTLEILRLDCNQIADLPRPLFHCHGLKELWLSDNEIALLPPALASLIHLQVCNFFLFSRKKIGLA